MSELHPREVIRILIASGHPKLEPQTLTPAGVLLSPLASCEAANSLDNDDSDTGFLFQER